MRLETVKRYVEEGRGEWWFYPLWKKILCVILFPFVMLWLGVCWCVMKIGRGLFQLGDLMSGFRWNEGNWMEDV